MMNFYGIVPRLLPLFLAVAAVAAPAPGRFERPRAAIIISQASFQRDWQATQMSGHGWTGIANLADIPYDTLFLRDVVQPQVSGRYAVLVFAQCFAVEDGSALHARLMGCCCWRCSRRRCTGSKKVRWTIRSD